MGAAPLDELPGWARALLAEAPRGHLGLIDGRGRPRVLPVTYAIWEEAIWSAADQKPKAVPPRGLARLRWIARRPEAALTVDRYDDDWTRLAWAQALGRAEVLERAPEAALGALLAKYPQYRDRVPSGPFVRLEVERALCWRAAEPAGT